MGTSLRPFYVTTNNDLNSSNSILCNNVQHAVQAIQQSLTCFCSKNLQLCSQDQPLLTSRRKCSLTRWAGSMLSPKMGLYFSVILPTQLQEIPFGLSMVTKLRWTSVSYWSLLQLWVSTMYQNFRLLPPLSPSMFSNPSRRLCLKMSVLHLMGLPQFPNELYLCALQSEYLTAWWNITSNTNFVSYWSFLQVRCLSLATICHLLWNVMEGRSENKIILSITTTLT